MNRLQRHIRPAVKADIPAILPVLEAARRIMQHCIQKAGFQYCGIIYLSNGDERLAYQFSQVSQDIHL